MVYPSAGENSSPERNENGILAQDASRTPNSEIQTTERDTELGPTHVEAQNVYTDEAITARSSANIADFRTLATEANEANERERNMTMLDAFKTYPKAIGWSALASLCAALVGYGTVVVGSYMAFPALMGKIGGGLGVSKAWRNGFSAAATLGQIFGALVSNSVSDQLSYRWTMILLLVGNTGFVFIPTFAESCPIFLVGYLLQSAIWGAFQPLAVTYSSEVCPVPLRHSLVAFVFLCSVIGQILASGALVAFQSREDEWSYRGPFLIQIIWLIPVGLGIYLAPESPWWYVRKGYMDRAQKSLKRLKRNFSQHDIDTAIALMVYVDETEKRAAKGTTYRDCFRGPNLRRTEIVCTAWLATALSGTALGGWRSILFLQAGITSSIISTVNLVISLLTLIATITSWLLMNKVARKTSFFSGMSVILIVLLIIGFMGIREKLSQSEALATGTLFTFLPITGNVISPVVYTIAAEIPSTRLRLKTFALAHSVYLIADVAFVNIIVVRQMDPEMWNWGLKSCLFWAGINAFFVTYIYFKLPETKCRTYAELNILFDNKVPARKFASTKVAPLTEGTENTEEEQTVRLENTAAFEGQTRDVVVMLFRK